MPPKSSSKKTAAATWYHCETCQAHITTKERETHEKVCPIGNEAALEYIRGGQLFTCSLERRTFAVEELKDMPAKYTNNLIFISEGAMRLANFHIGQDVVISILEKAETSALVRAIWPVPEKFLTTVFVTEEDYHLNWTAFKGGVLKIAPLPQRAAAMAKSVQLRLEPSEKVVLVEQQLQDLERVLKQELKQLIYTKGSCVNFNFFNKQLKLYITDWRACEPLPEQAEDTALAAALQNLSLNKVVAGDFFKVVPTTRIEVLQESTQTTAQQEAEYLITKKDIGGLDKQIGVIEEAMELALGFRAIPKGVKISRGLLLYGPTGCGKSLICEAMCSAATEARGSAEKAQIIRLNASELFSKFLGETEKNLSAHFEKAYTHYPQPTLIIIEDVHNLCPKQETNDVAKRVTIAFLSKLDAMPNKSEATRIFILATTSQIDTVNPSVRRCGRFDCEVELGAPCPNEREAILQCLLRDVEHNLTADVIKEVAQITHGFVGADLANLISAASLLALKAGEAVTLAEPHLRAALTQVKPSAMREVLIENPNVHWTDIGGQSKLKLQLQQSIEWPLLHADKFKRLGIKPPRGLLMFGPPGCSKTMIAKALATESNLNFLSIKGPELFSMWVGESERAVREVFRKARQVAPAIVFFDEIDAIGGERADSGSGTGSSVKERVLTQLLTELDGVEALHNVTIVAATNRPDMIDKALMRPGRIDRIIYVGLPDVEARREIFRIKLRAMPLADNIDLEELVRRTEGYSGAEIQAVCHEAALKTLERSFEAEHVTWAEFEYALIAVQPRTSPELLKLYEEYMKRS